MKKYSAIILAAGYSSRMGELKPVIDFNGITPIERCISLFENCGINNIIVVTGYQTDRIQDFLKTGIKNIINNQYSEGMFSSVQAGVEAVSEDTNAFFLLPVDIPSVKEHTVKMLLERYEKLDDGILFPTFNDEKGHPTLISCSLVKEILTQKPAGGLRDILNIHKEKWHFEEVVDRGILLDMDTQGDLKILLEHVVREPFLDYEECMEILRLCNVKQDTIDHMKAVSELSKRIAALLNEKGYNLNVNAVVAGALLHDVAKGKKGHAQEGAKIVANFGYECLSKIIDEHIELKSVGEISEKEIVYISDKLIKGTQYITLSERFENAFEKYKNEPEILKNVNRRYEQAKKIKEDIEELLGTSLENLR